MVWQREVVAGVALGGRRQRATLLEVVHLADVVDVLKDGLHAQRGRCFEPWQAEGPSLRAEPVAAVTQESCLTSGPMGRWQTVDLLILCLKGGVLRDREAHLGQGVGERGVQGQGRVALEGRVGGAAQAGVAGVDLRQHEGRQAAVLGRQGEEALRHGGAHGAEGRQWGALQPVLWRPKPPDPVAAERQVNQFFVERVKPTGQGGLGA